MLGELEYEIAAYNLEIAFAELKYILKNTALPEVQTLVGFFIA